MVDIIRLYLGQDLASNEHFECCSNEMKKELVTIHCPNPGITVFSSFENENFRIEDQCSAPLKLLKVLMDRDEIRLHSSLVARLHVDILEYSYSFEPVCKLSNCVF